MPRQLTLPVRLRDAASFESFLAGPNKEVVERLRSAADGGGGHSCLYLWGERGCGRTHLLQAVCRRAADSGVRAMYLPLGEPSLGVDVLDDSDEFGIVCVDDVQTVSGNLPWERALLSLFERLTGRAGQLIVCADAPPGRLGLHLHDLSSRLSSGLVYQIGALDDAGKVAALKLRAKRRGFELPDTVVRYVLQRYSRDTSALFELLDRIDRLSLAEQRRVTIPFLRELERRHARDAGA